MGKSRWSALAVAALVFAIVPTVALAAQPPFDTNAECLECHDVAWSGSAFTKVDFSVGPVDKSTACNKCHWIGDHPIHRADANCAQCHQGFPRRVDFFKSVVQTPFGYFSSSASVLTSAAQVHDIHVNGSWPMNAAVPGKTLNCVSCHAPAACGACHQDLGRHGGHSSSIVPTPTLRVTSGVPATSTVTDTTYDQPVGCARSGCHAPTTASLADVETYVDDRAASLSGSWGFGSLSYAYGGTFIASQENGAEAVLVVSGAGELRVYAPKSLTGGIIAIVVDNGAPVYVDLYATTRLDSVRVHSVRVGPGTHTVRVIVTALGSGPWGYLDAVSIRSDGAPAGEFGGSPCASCHITKTDTHGYVDSQHAANVGAVLDPSGKSCDSCHSVDLGTEHRRASSASAAASCGACHPTPRNTFGAWNDTCQQGGCHAPGSSSAKHSRMATAHAPPAGVSCAAAGCHTAALDVIHAQAVKMGAVSRTSCNVCHTATEYPTTKDCTACHTTTTSHRAAHQTVSSSECVACHEYGNVQDQHSPAAIGATRGGKTNDGCNICHGGDGWADVRTGSTRECVTCHRVGKVGDRAYTPKDPSHYSAATHTATNTTITPGGACSSCHSLDMKTEHYKPTVAFSLGGYPDKCVACHELKVDAFTSVWDKTCQMQGCHAAKHGDQNASHESNRAECGGAGCHNINSVSAIHSGPKSSCATCHKSATQPATTVDCLASGCHAGSSAGHHESHDTSGTVDGGCRGCHFIHLDDEHTKLGYTCDTCHRSVNAAVIAAIAGDQRNCAACHPAVNGRDRHSGQKTMEFVSGNASMHRVYSSLPGMRSSFVVSGTTYNMPLPSASAFLKTGWTASSVVTCDNCHTFSGTAAGPHGAAVTVNIDPAYPTSFKTVWLSNTSNGMSSSSVICAKCHDLNGTGSTWSNRVHGEGDHHKSDKGKCVHCHSQVPHGWRLPRLLAYTTDPAPYNTITGGLQQLKLRNYASPSDWVDSDCYAACAGDHSRAVSPIWPSTAPPAYGALTGRVTAASGAGISAAAVSIASGGSTTTDANGYYAFASVLTGTQQVTVSKSGYVSQTASATVSRDQTTTLNFTMVESPPYDNIARGKAASASSQRSGYEAAKAVDGSTSTRWYSSSGGTQWLTIDLGAGASIDKIVVVWYSSDYARAYQVQTSTDGASWTNVFSTSSGTSGTKTHTFAARDARYVRIYCTSANSSGGYGITELEVWGRMAPVTTGAITGRVTDSSSGAGISAASVSVSGGPSTSTDSNGHYTLSSVSSGTASVTYAKSGYTTQTLDVPVSGGATTTRNVALVPVVTVTNLALNKSFTASRFESSTYSPSKAGDGDTATFWWSKKDGRAYDSDWLTVDLGSRFRISKVELAWFGSYWAKEYRVHTSTDNSTWTEVYNTSSGSSGTRTHTFSARDARYVRVECRRTSGSNTGYGVAEFRVFQ